MHPLPVSYMYFLINFFDHYDGENQYLQLTRKRKDLILIIQLVIILLNWYASYLHYSCWQYFFVSNLIIYFIHTYIIHDYHSCQQPYHIFFCFLEPFLADSLVYSNCNHQKFEEINTLGLVSKIENLLTYSQLYMQRFDVPYSLMCFCPWNHWIILLLLPIPILPLLLFFVVCC